MYNVAYSHPFISHSSIKLMKWLRLVPHRCLHHAYLSSKKHASALRVDLPGQPRLISSSFLPQLFVSHWISCYKTIQYASKNISMLWDMATIISSVEILLLAVSCTHKSRCHLFTPHSHPNVEARFFTECWMMINKSLTEITEAWAAVGARSLVLCDGFYFNSVVRWSNNLI